MLWENFKISSFKSTGNQAYCILLAFSHFLDLEYQLLSSPPAVVSFLPAYSVASFLFRFYPTQLKYTFNPHYRLFICPFQFIWLVRYCSAHFNLCSFLRFFLPLHSTRQLTRLMSQYFYLLIWRNKSDLSNLHTAAILKLRL